MHSGRGQIFGRWLPHVRRKKLLVRGLAALRHRPSGLLHDGKICQSTIKNYISSSRRCTVVFKFWWGGGYFGLWGSLAGSLICVFNFIFMPTYFLSFLRECMKSLPHLELPVGTNAENCLFHHCMNNLLLLIKLIHIIKQIKSWQLPIPCS